MHLIAIAWIYVVLMMALAEAMSSQGTVLGAVFTFLLYGALPLGIVLYIFATPARKRMIREREAHAAALDAAASAAPAAIAATASTAPDGSGHAPGAAAATEGKEA
jgi:hypothetical protein